MSTNRLPILAALVMLSGFATAAVMFVNGDNALERVGLLVALLTTGVLSLTSLLKSDESARNTDSGSRLLRTLNGGLEKRMKAAVRDVRDEPGDSLTPEGDREAPEYYGDNRPKEPHE